MSARDDYPADVGWGGDQVVMPTERYGRMADEIDRLRAENYRLRMEPERRRTALIEGVPVTAPDDLEREGR